MLFIIGDIHGDLRDKKTRKLNIEAYTEFCDQLPVGAKSIQVGDLGYGFLTVQQTQVLNEWFQANPQHKFIRGNHDCLKLCLDSHGFIKDGTYDPDTRTLYVGGAESTDRLKRTEGVNWWADEQVDYETFGNIMDMEMQVDRVIAHDLPFMQCHNVCSGTVLPNITRHGLQAIHAKFKPKEWFCGHYHVKKSWVANGTVFKVLPELNCKTGIELVNREGWVQV